MVGYLPTYTGYEIKPPEVCTTTGFILNGIRKTRYSHLGTTSHNRKLKRPAAYIKIKICKVGNLMFNVGSRVFSFS